MKSFIEFVESLEPVHGTQMGSNPGGIHKDTETGDKYYVKHYANPDHAKVEVLTGKIYDHMGIHTAKPEMHGDSGVKTKWIEHLKQMPPKDFEHLNSHQANQIGKMYHGAILTKNWDVVGLEHDNIVKNHQTGDLHAIDHGAGFHFRARGSHKDYGPDINEKDSLRNNHEASGHVFSTTFKQHPEAERHGLESVKNMNMDHIHNLFQNSGLHNWKDLHSNFVQRRNNLLDHYKNS